MKYEVQHLLPAVFDPGKGDADRPALVPGQIVIEQQIKDYGHDLDRLLRPRHRGFGAALMPVAGTEDAPLAAPSQFDAAEPLTGGAVDTIPKVDAPVTASDGKVIK